MESSPKMPSQTVKEKDEAELLRKRDAFLASMALLQQATNTVCQASFEYFNRITEAHHEEDPTPHYPLNSSLSPAKRKSRVPSRPVHPDQPKKPLSAYLQYCADGRERVKRELGPGHDSHKEIIAELTTRWINTPKSEKGKWIHREYLENEVYKKNLAIYDVKMQNIDNIRAGSVSAMDGPHPSFDILSEQEIPRSPFKKAKLDHDHLGEHFQRSSTPVYNSPDSDFDEPRPRSPFNDCHEDQTNGPDTTRAELSPVVTPTKRTRKKSNRGGSTENARVKKKSPGNHESLLASVPGNAPVQIADKLTNFKRSSKGEKTKQLSRVGS